METITCSLNYWEAHNVVLDPITREVVLDSLVVIHIATCQGYADLVNTAREEHTASCDSGPEN